MSNRSDILSRAARSFRNRSKTLLRQWRTRLRAILDGVPRLPPGRLNINDSEYWKDDLFLLRQSRRFGPVFKTNISGQVVTCIVDHQRSRRILSEHVQRLASPGAPYDKLVPGGFLRNQTGETHQATRRAFIRALLSLIHI